MDCWFRLSFFLCVFLTRTSCFVFFCILLGSCLVVSTSVFDCLDRLVPELYNVSSGMLNFTHSLTHCIDYFVHSEVRAEQR